MATARGYCYVLLSATLLLTQGCIQGANVQGAAPYSITISWNANPESAVNSAGGGYIVYYSKNPFFQIPNADSIQVPYVSGPKAPTSAVITNLQLHAPASYFFRVVAYSSLQTPLGTTAVSTPSALASFTVP